MGHQRRATCRQACCLQIRVSQILHVAVEEKGSGTCTRDVNLQDASRFRGIGGNRGRGAYERWAVYGTDWHAASEMMCVLQQTSSKYMSVLVFPFCLNIHYIKPLQE